MRGWEMNRTDRSSNIWRTVCLFVFSILLIAGITEIGARVWLERFASLSTFLRFASFQQLTSENLGRARASGTSDEMKGFQNALYLKYTARPYIRYIPTPNYVRGDTSHNSLGYRGEEFELQKPAGEFRIVCLGGSTTYTSLVQDNNKTYPAQLREHLRARASNNILVVNAGAEGYASYDSLINFQFRVLELSPDMIIVYHGVNDINARLVKPEAYVSDASGMHAEISVDSFMPPLYEYSTALRIILISAGSLEAHSNLTRAINPPADTYLLWQFIDQRSRGVYPRGYFRHVSAAEILRKNPPQYFQRNLYNLIRLAKAHDAIPVLATFAHSPKFVDNPFASSPEFAAAYAEMNEIIRRLAESEGIPLFDFAAVFPDDMDLYWEGLHVNEKGAALKGRLFADYLIAENLVPAGSNSNGTPSFQPE